MGASNPGWKAFERDVARLFGGRRFWANSGERLDVESAGVVAQCKEVKRLSLAELTDLAEAVEREAAGKFKAGVVAVRLKRAPGRPRAPVLLVVTAATWERMNGAPTLRVDNWLRSRSDWGISTVERQADTTAAVTRAIGQTLDSIAPRKAE